MALDETLLDVVSKPQACPQTYLRFYQWIRPTLSLGISQKAARVADLDYCSVHGIDVVRRPTGGKAVLHQHELTYSVISNDPAFFPIADISKTYCRIAKALQRGFHFLGIETTLASGRGANAPTGPLPAACFALSNRSEVLWQDRKLAGSAQRRTKTAFLQHGTILIEFDPELLSKVLRSCDVTSLATAVTDLKTCLGSTPSIFDLMGVMCRGFEAVFEVQLVNRGLHEDLSARALDLANQKLALLKDVSMATPSGLSFNR